MTTSGSFLKILRTPTAPTKETLVLKNIVNICAEKKFPYFYDKKGNLIVGASNLKELQRAPLAFTIHSDHPGGIVLNKKENSLLTCEWLGGVHARISNQKVIIFDVSTGRQQGGIVQSQAEEQRLGIFTVRTDVGSLGDIANLGVCVDTPVKIAGDYVYCRGADNLASVASACLWLAKFAQRDLPFVFIFTRCEEEGQRGADFIASLLTKKTKIVCVDASDCLPGIGLGSGLLIKHGDINGIFSEKLTRLLLSICKSERIKFSEIYRTKGECEASTFAAHGFDATSIGIAVQNYHNSGPFAQTVRSEEFHVLDASNLIEFFGILSTKLKKILISPCNL